MLSPHDAELMRRWQAGEDRAFETLVRRWQQPMARFLHRLTGRAALVPDLCQEVFLRVYQAGGSYRESGNFAGWLYRIALNVARDGSRRRQLTFLADDAEPEWTGETADATCVRRELADVVARAVAELPEPMRVVLTLRHDEGLSFEDIARLISAPASTVKSRFAAALSRLRQRLGRLGLGPEEMTA